MISETPMKPTKKRSRTSTAIKNDPDGSNGNVNYDMLKLHQCGNCVFCQMPQCDRCAGCVGLNNGEGRGGSSGDEKEDTGCCLRKVSG